MASTYTQLKKGSAGNEVNALQEALNKKGYSLANTGIYDDATEAAVRQYQTDYGLDVDGVAGDITLGSLYGTSNASQQDGYTPSEQLAGAQKYAENVQAQKPGEYESPYAQQLQQQFDAIMNRQPFSYDVGADPMFMQASDRYVQQGRRAMQDTMGKAAELTGGYGNSYAQGTGQAAYGAYLQELSAQAPEYMNAAFARYQNEGADMLDRYNMTMGLEEQAYSRYQDRLNNYYAEQDRQQKVADTNREYAYNTAMLMLQGGKMPSTMLLEAAGISAEDAETIMAMYTPKKTSSSNSNNNNDKKANSNTTKVYSNPATYAKSSVENLEESVKNGDIKVTDTNMNDGILSLHDYTANREAVDPFYAAKQQTQLGNTYALSQQAKSDTESYKDYVADTIESDLLSQKIDKNKAIYLMQKYLID